MKTLDNFKPLTRDEKEYIIGELTGKLSSVTYDKVLDYLVKNNKAQPHIVNKLPTYINRFRRYVNRLIDRVDDPSTPTLDLVMKRAKTYRSVWLDGVNNKGQMVINFADGHVKCGVNTLVPGLFNVNNSPDFTRGPRIDENVPGDTSYHIKDLKGYEGIYKIDTNGNVWSVKRGKKLSSFMCNGICCVGLSKNGVHKNCGLARLVALTFIPNPYKYPCVHHKDKNPENNKVENLFWYRNAYGYVKK